MAIITFLDLIEPFNSQTGQMITGYGRTWGDVAIWRAYSSRVRA